MSCLSFKSERAVQFSLDESVCQRITLFERKSNMNYAKSLYNQSPGHSICQRNLNIR